MINRADVKIVSDDVNQILSDTIADYERRTGKQLQPAHIEQSILQTYAYRELLVRKGVNEAFLQTFPQFATGVALDLCGEPMGCYRLEDQPARCTLKFAVDDEHAGVIIPKGTLVGVNEAIVFATEIELIIPEGVSYVDVIAVCTTPGELGNGWQVGQVKNALSKLESSITVGNIDVTNGGVHVEDDDSYRKRILLAPEAFTTCGSVAAYEYHTLSVSQYISDVFITTPTGGVVKVVVLAKDGIPNASLLAQVSRELSAERKRPLCDNVQVVAPEEISFEINATVTVLSDAVATDIVKRAKQSLDDYLSHRFNKLGKDIIPLDISHALKIAGVYNVDLTSPTLTKLSREQWARCTSINIVIAEGREDG